MKGTSSQDQVTAVKFAFQLFRVIFGRGDYEFLPGTWMDGWMAFILKR